MRSTTILAASLAAALLSIPALAQDAPPDRPGQRQRQQQRDRMTPEESKAVWQLQAQGVAKGLTLSAETTDQLVRAYVEARETAGRAMRGRGPGGDGAGSPPPDRGEGRGAGRGGRGGFGMPDMTEQREALAKTLASFLSEEQVKKAMPALGSFNRSWDSMVFAVHKLELGEAKTFEALKPIEQYVVTMSKAIESGDRASMRETMMEARSTLQEKMSKILDEEQMEQFQQSTRMRQRGARGAQLMQYDDNGDGKIQKSELPEGEGLEELFDRLDRNGDGELDAEELRGGRGGRGGGRGGDPNNTSPKLVPASSVLAAAPGRGFETSGSRPFPPPTPRAPRRLVRPGATVGSRHRPGSRHGCRPVRRLPNAQSGGVAQFAERSERRRSSVIRSSSLHGERCRSRSSAVSGRTRSS